MKNTLLKLSATLLLSFQLTLALAQAPQKMSYQAVIRNAGNALVTSSPIGMQISILQGSPTGTAVYVETQTATTNTNGLVTIEIGNGTPVTGIFSSINWATGPYFIMTETDPTGGTTYSITGTTQLMSVPYALYAETSGTGGVGPTGPQGPAGADGINGAVGATGSQGPAGADGINGAIGATGATGADGLTGLQGPQGIAGTNGTNGVAGATGAMGPIGPQGIAGTNGTNGTTGAGGATGPQGIAGTNGTNGTNGAVGATGTTGSQGPQGLQGPAGADGLDGVTGAQGPQGFAGTNGTNGVTGADGPQGPQGLQGPAGANGLDGVTGATGATGLLPNGAAAGNTPYWNGTAWVVNNSNIFNNGGNVGIGTSTPGAKLEVTGGSLYFNQDDAGIVVDAGGLKRVGFMKYIGLQGALVHNSATPLRFGRVTNTDITAATSATYTDEMIIDASGNVGIGTTTPAYKLDIQNAGNVLMRARSMAANSFVSLLLSNPERDFMLTNNAADDLLSFYYGTGNRLQFSLTNQWFNSGNVGIGTTSPNAALQFGNVLTNRRIVLWEDVNNDHQFYGFGINGNTLRYQVAALSQSHVFYAGTSATTSNELMRIQGDGKVGIGTSSPTSKLQVVGLPVFADNASALAGGLTVGAFYRTATGVLMVAF